MKFITRIFAGFFLLLALTPTGALCAQRASITDSEAAYLRKCGHIEGGDGIAGYYFLTRVSKEKMVRKGNKRKPKTVYYSRLTLMDQGLNVIGAKDFKEEDDISVLDVAYNGTYLAVKMINHEDERKWVEVLDAAGEKIRRGSLSYGAYDTPKVAEQMAAFIETGISPLRDGFLDLTVEATGKNIMSRSGYQAKYIPNDPENKGFVIRSPRNSKEYEMAQFLASSDSLIVLTVMRRPNMLSQKFSTNIVAYHTRTGKREWEVKASEKAYPTRWFSAEFQGEELVLGGMDVGANGKLFTDIPEGLSFQRISADGTILETKRIDLDEALDQFVTGGSGGAGKFGNLYLHDMELTDAGEVLVTAEFYKTFNGGATAREGLILHLDPAYALVGVELIEKGKTSNGRGLANTLRGGVNLAKKGSVAALAKVDGTFDHAFLRSNGPSVTAVYFAGRSEVKETKQLGVYITNLLDGELVSEKMLLNAESDEVVALPAKEGYIMLVEYDQDGKSLDIHMERLQL